MPKNYLIIQSLNIVAQIKKYVIKIVIRRQVSEEIFWI